MELNELQIKWLKELRSGKYKQGYGGLRNRDNEFCCLGVLCDISPWDGAWEPPGFGKAYYSYVASGGEEFDAVLPEELMADVGLSLKEIRDLADLNDRRRLMFEQIADHLEQLWKK